MIPILNGEFSSQKTETEKKTQQENMQHKKMQIILGLHSMISEVNHSFHCRKLFCLLFPLKIKTQRNQIE